MSLATEFLEDFKREQGQGTVGASTGISPYRPMIEEHATKLGVDPDFVERILMAESNGNPKAVSSKGAQGLMQIMPNTWKDLAAKDPTLVDPFDPNQNIKAGVSYLAWLHKMFGGNSDKVASAYYAGPYGNFDNPETTAYREKVRAGAKPVAAPVQSRDPVADIVAQARKEFNIPEKPSLVQGALETANKYVGQPAEDFFLKPPKETQIAQYGPLAEPTDYGLRTDGTPKGRGFLGELKRPDGRVSTELSMGVVLPGRGTKETLIPLMVPTLNTNEVDYLLARETGQGPDNSVMGRSIFQKAVAHAQKRLDEGRSPFIEKGETISVPKKEWTGVLPDAGRIAKDLYDRTAEVTDQFVAENQLAREAKIDEFWTKEHWKSFELRPDNLDMTTGPTSMLPSSQIAQARERSKESYNAPIEKILNLPERKMTPYNTKKFSMQEVVDHAINTAFASLPEYTGLNIRYDAKGIQGLANTVGGLAGLMVGAPAKAARLVEESMLLKIPWLRLKVTDSALTRVFKSVARDSVTMPAMMLTANAGSIAKAESPFEELMRQTPEHALFGIKLGGLKGVWPKEFTDRWKRIIVGNVILGSVEGITNYDKTDPLSFYGLVAMNTFMSRHGHFKGLQEIEANIRDRLGEEIEREIPTVVKNLEKVAEEQAARGGVPAPNTNIMSVLSDKIVNDTAEKEVRDGIVNGPFQQERDIRKAKKEADAKLAEEGKVIKVADSKDYTTDKGYIKKVVDLERTLGPEKTREVYASLGLEAGNQVKDGVSKDNVLKALKAALPKTEPEVVKESEVATESTSGEKVTIEEKPAEEQPVAPVVVTEPSGEKITTEEQPAWKLTTGQSYTLRNKKFPKDIYKNFDQATAEQALASGLKYEDWLKTPEGEKYAVTPKPVVEPKPEPPKPVGPQLEKSEVIGNVLYVTYSKEGYPTIAQIKELLGNAKGVTVTEMPYGTFRIDFGKTSTTANNKRAELMQKDKFSNLIVPKIIPPKPAPVEPTSTTAQPEAKPDWFGEKETKPLDEEEELSTKKEEPLDTDEISPEAEAQYEKWEAEQLAKQKASEKEDIELPDVSPIWEEVKGIADKNPLMALQTLFNYVKSGMIDDNEFADLATNLLKTTPRESFKTPQQYAKFVDGITKGFEDVATFIDKRESAKEGDAFREADRITDEDGNESPDPRDYTGGRILTIGGMNPEVMKKLYENVTKGLKNLLESPEVFYAFHGTNNWFRQFETDKYAGTGAGGKLRGHGAYLSEAESLGEHYAEKIKYKDITNTQAQRPLIHKFKLPKNRDWLDLEEKLNARHGKMILNQIEKFVAEHERKLKEEGTVPNLSTIGKLKDLAAEIKEFLEPETSEWVIGQKIGGYGVIDTTIQRKGLLPWEGKLYKPGTLITREVYEDLISRGYDNVSIVGRLNPVKLVPMESEKWKDVLGFKAGREIVSPYEWDAETNKPEVLVKEGEVFTSRILRTLEDQGIERISVFDGESTMPRTVVIPYKRSAMVGEELQRELWSALGSKKSTTEFLNEAGFIGNSYIGETSGFRNHVLFDDKLARYVGTRVLESPLGKRYLNKLAHTIALEGIEKFSAFRSKLKEVTGDLWEQVKPFSVKLWKEAKNWLSKMSLKGKITFKDSDPRGGGTQLNIMIPLDKVPTLVKDFIISAGIPMSDIYRNMDIWNHFKMWLGRDHFWRYEINDRDIDYDTVKLATREYSSMKLSSVVKSPELYKAIPILKDYTIQYDPDRLTGFHSRQEKKIYLNNLTRAQIFHEIQHGINYAVNTPFTGAVHGQDFLNAMIKITEQMEPGMRDKFIDYSNRLYIKNNHDYTESSFYNEIVPWIYKNVPDLTKFVEDLPKMDQETAYENYMKHPGEMESRLISYRSMMTSKQRADEPPWESLDKMLIKEGRDPLVGNKLYSGIPIDAIGKMIGRVFRGAGNLGESSGGKSSRRENKKFQELRRKLKLLATELDWTDLRYYLKLHRLTDKDLLLIARNEFGRSIKLNKLTQEEAGILKLKILNMPFDEKAPTEETIENNPNISEAMKKKLGWVMKVYDVDEFDLNDMVALTTKGEPLNNTHLLVVMDSLKLSKEIRASKDRPIFPFLRPAIRIFGEDFISTYREAEVDYAKGIIPFYREINSIFRKLDPERREAITKYREGLLSAEVMSPEDLIANSKLSEFYDKMFTYFEIEKNAPYVSQYSPRIGLNPSRKDLINWVFSRHGVANFDQFFAEHKRTGDLPDRMLDAYELANRYIRAGMRKKFFGPAHAKSEVIMNTFSKERQTLARNWIDTVIKKQPTTSEILLNRGIRKFIGMLGFKTEEHKRYFRDVVNNLLELNYSAFMGLRPKLSIRDLTQQVLIMNEYGYGAWARGAAGKYRADVKAAMGKSVVLRGRLTEYMVEEGKFEVPNMPERIRNKMMFMYRWSDSNNVRTAFATGYLKLKDTNPNLLESQYIAAGEKAVRNTQWGYGTDLPYFFRTPTGKLLGQYSSWSFWYMDHLWRMFRERNGGAKARTLMQATVAYMLYAGTGVNYLNTVLSGAMPQSFGYLPRTGYDLLQLISATNNPDKLKGSFKTFMRDVLGLVPGELAAKDLIDLSTKGDVSQYFLFEKKKKKERESPSLYKSSGGLGDMSGGGLGDLGGDLGGL